MLKVMYGRLMKYEPRWEYVGENVKFHDVVDMDIIGMLNVCGFVEDIGYNDKGSLRLWV